MIVVENKSWLRTLLTLRGSVLSRIWRRLLAVMAFAVAGTAMYYEGWLGTHTLTVVPFMLVGFALSIFLGFRNTTAYDRYWEGRKLWGQLVNTSRTLARQGTTLVAAVAVDADDGREAAACAAHRERFVRGIIGYVHALRMRLREDYDARELAPHLGEAATAALDAERNRPIALLQRLGEQVAEAFRRGWLHPQHVAILDQSVTALCNAQGGCEPIRSTPLPYAYNVLMHRIIASYCLTLPFGIVDATQLLTPLVVLMVSYAFFGLDAIAEEIEDPFGVGLHDLPLDALSRTIEINLRQRLGDADLPEPLTPVRDALT